MNEKKIGVALSVYKSDILSDLKKSIESIQAQTFSNIKVFIEVDGRVSDDVRSYLDQVGDDDRISVNYNSENRGLAFRLNQIIDKFLQDKTLTHLARMDADDISHIKRFEKQIDFFTKNPNVDVIGTSMYEINQQGIIQSYKKMPVDDGELKNKIIKRCPFNHPTVIFQRRVLEDGNRYPAELKNTQDYYLWINLAKKGYTFANIDEPLLFFRVNNSFFERRGKNKAKNDFNAKVYAMNVLECHSIKNWMYAIAIYILRISPSKLSKLAYKYLRNTQTV